MSSRLPKDWTVSPWAEALQEARRSGDEIVDLTVSSPQAVGLGFDREVLTDQLRASPWLEWSPDPRGAEPVRRAVCTATALAAVGATPDEILLTASTSEAYGLLFTLLCDAGDAVLVPRPGYPLLDVLAGLHDLRCEDYRLVLHEGRWRLDWDSLEAASTNAQILLLVEPANPTGSLLELEDYERLVEFSARRRLAVVVDEVFADYVFASPAAPPWGALSEAAPVFRLNGLSKSVGLPQLKLAWIWHRQPPAMRETIDRGLEYVADAYLNVSSPAQALAPWLLENAGPFRERVRERLRRNLGICSARLGAWADRRPAPQGGWYQCFGRDGLDDERTAVRLLEQERILVHPGYLFDFAEDGWLVVSLLPDPSCLDAALKRLVAVVS